MFFNGIMGLRRRFNKQQINLTLLNFCLAQLWKSKHFHNIRSLKFGISFALH